MKLLAILALVLGLFNVAQAQTSTTDLVKEWERAKAYTQEYLDAMPESGYSLKPTPDMRSFAGQMLHLTDANYGFAAAATDESPRSRRTRKISRSIQGQRDQTGAGRLRLRHQRNQKNDTGATRRIH